MYIAANEFVIFNWSILNNLVYIFLASFEVLIEVSVDATGLAYHSSQYGVTLIVPEGAVKAKTIILAYREILQKYLIAKTEQRLPDYSLLDFCFLFEQKI